MSLGVPERSLGVPQEALCTPKEPSGTIGKSPGDPAQSLWTQEGSLGIHVDSVGILEKILLDL